ncbi:MAG: DUF1801 domain-containing protein [Thermoplasmata archaeon]|nr:DUF1801 domain-containing protein [Thermoplasmata archaeon]
MTTTSRTDPKVDRAIANLPPDLRAIASALRIMVRRSAPDLRESLKWQNPVWSGRGNVICLMLFTNHVNLGFFRGAELTSRYPGLEGTGKGMRHVKVPTMGAARAPVLAKIVRDAAAQDAAGR